MSRFARSQPVYFFEEPARDAEAAWLELSDDDSGVVVATPHLPQGVDDAEAEALQRGLLDQLVEARGIVRPILWYYTPMALAFSDQLTSSLVVYDCMDELSAFRFAPARLIEQEQALLDRADVVFTGGQSLFEAKRNLHRNVHAFPSSVDAAHFRTARTGLAEPEDQRATPRPRVGFAGVIDERMDLALLDGLAALRPDLHFVMIGPVVKIDPAELPDRPNIHWLGGKAYAELPAYMASWDAAMMPFALNESTRFISPTKTPEYLSAGLPVVSTRITDVVSPYGERGLVHIADTAEAFAEALDRAMADRDDAAWRIKVDRFIATMSWDDTQGRMRRLMQAAMRPAGAPAEVGASRARREARADSFDFLIVGAGFAGSVIAERLAAGSGARVLLIDRRPHVGGNAYDHHDAAGVLVHRYGPHIFHTNSQEVFDYLSRFTAWRRYEHRVLAHVDDKLVPIPINRTTLNRLYDLDLSTPEEVAAFLQTRAEPVEDIRTSEDVVVSAVGRELYVKFFRDYTRKQWGMYPSQLDRSVTARVPTRHDEDDRYFTDRFQVMPRHGFTRMFERMLDHPNIKIMLNTDYREVRDLIEHREVVFTGPVDEFFDHRFGALPYRSLMFRHETVNQRQVQPVAVINHPGPDVDFTRVTEFKHLTGQDHPRTSLCYEFPAAGGDPYYPIPRPENAALYKRYEALANATEGVHFVGRLATYRYYNMDQVVAQALTLYARMTATPRAAATRRTLQRDRDMAANA